MNPSTLLRAIEEYKSIPGNGVGGSLHIYTDDGNYEREHIEFCRVYARENNDLLGELLARELLKLTVGERQELYERHWGRA